MSDDQRDLRALLRALATPVDLTGPADGPGEADRVEPHRQPLAEATLPTGPGVRHRVTVRRRARAGVVALTAGVLAVPLLTLSGSGPTDVLTALPTASPGVVLPGPPSAVAPDPSPRLAAPPAVPSATALPGGQVPDPSVTATATGTDAAPDLGLDATAAPASRRYPPAQGTVPAPAAPAPTRGVVSPERTSSVLPTTVPRRGLSLELQAPRQVVAGDPANFTIDVSDDKGTLRSGVIRYADQGGDGLADAATRPDCGPKSVDAYQGTFATSHVFPAPGHYQVTVQVKSGGGCTAAKQEVKQASVVIDVVLPATPAPTAGPTSPRPVPTTGGPTSPAPTAAPASNAPPGKITATGSEAPPWMPGDDEPGPP